MVGITRFIPTKSAHLAGSSNQDSARGVTSRHREYLELKYLAVGRPVKHNKNDSDPRDCMAWKRDSTRATEPRCQGESVHAATLHMERVASGTGAFKP